MQNKGLLVALLVPVMALAQGRHAARHSSAPQAHSSQPVTPTRPTGIGFQSQPGIYTGTNSSSGIPQIGLQSQPGIYTGANGSSGIPQIGLQSEPGIFTGINNGAYSASGLLNANGGGVAAASHSRRPVLYGLPYFPVLGYYPPEASYAPEADPNTEQSAQVSSNILGEQVERLSAEVESLRNDRQQPVFAAAQPEPAPLPITLVLHNGKSLLLSSYAVMNGEIWDLSGQSTRPIPLADIDLQASQTTTEAAGGVFPSIADQH